MWIWLSCSREPVIRNELYDVSLLQLSEREREDKRTIIKCWLPTETEHNTHEIMTTMSLCWRVFFSFHEWTLPLPHLIWLSRLFFDYLFLFSGLLSLFFTFYPQLFLLLSTTRQSLWSLFWSVEKKLEIFKITITEIHNVFTAKLVYFNQFGAKLHKVRERIWKRWAI